MGVSESFPVSTNCTCATRVQQIAFPLGLSDLERFNQRQLRYPTIVLLQLTLGWTAFEPTSFFLPRFLFPPRTQFNRFHNRATRTKKSNKNKLTNSSIQSNQSTIQFLNAWSSAKLRALNIRSIRMSAEGRHCRNADNLRWIDNFAPPKQWNFPPIINSGGTKPTAWLVSRNSTPGNFSSKKRGRRPDTLLITGKRRRLPCIVRASGNSDTCRERVHRAPLTRLLVLNFNYLSGTRTNCSPRGTFRKKRPPRLSAGGERNAAHASSPLVGESKN